MTRLKTLALAALATMAAGPAMAQPEGSGKPIDAGHHFQTPVTAVMENIIWLDDFMHIIMAVIVLFVTALLLIAIFKFNRKANPTPATWTHNTTIEIVWTAVPVIILVVIAIPSLKLLFQQLEVPPADVTIKAIGVEMVLGLRVPGRGHRGRRHHDRRGRARADRRHQGGTGRVRLQRGRVQAGDL